MKKWIALKLIDWAMKLYKKFENDWSNEDRALFERLDFERKRIGSMK